ncbi:hypothetical protein SLE2022_238520 [Rubroshorea leprosula]
MIHEVTVDEENPPDVDDEEHSDFENMSEANDSMHTFTVILPTHPTLVATGGGDDKGFLWGLAKEIGLLNSKIMEILCLV